ncbi:MAG: MFS transporter [Corynebacteriales bacterium]|nr:MFS transporter [Mycobacteriales bacterium]
MTTEASPKAGRREWIGLAVLALPAMLIAMDMSVLYLAIPHLSADLSPNSSELLWILDIYGFLIAGFLITMGNIGDRIGRRKLLMLGAGAFGVASILAAYSPNAETLIASRALLGIAGATLMPSTLALIRNMFHDPAQRTAAIGAWMTSFMVGMTIGPLVGGALLENFWWGSAFLLAVPAMVLLLATAPALLPEYRDPNPGRMDFPSVGLSLAAVLPNIYGIKEIAKDGIDLLPIAAIVLGVIMGVIFVRRQRTLESPMLDLRLFTNRKFAASLGTLTLTIFAMSGVFFFLAQYLQLVLGLSAFEAGLWTLPQAIAMAVAALVTPALAKRIRPAYLMASGLVIAVMGFAMFTQLDGADDLALIVSGMVVFSIGLSPMMILGMDLIMGAVSPEKAGAASALSETNQEFAMAIGVALLGSAGTAVYRDSLADNMPTDVPAAAAESARDSLGEATVVAQVTPNGAELLDAARQAFTDALHLNAYISIGLVSLAAVLVAVLLRHVPASGNSDAPTPETEPEESSEKHLAQL